MRPIKFRAWDKKIKKWLSPKEIETELILNPSLVEDGRFEINECNDERDLVAYALGTTIELMQYTGLCDKNGKEIYEGDIIKNRWGLIGKVFIRLGCWFLENSKELGYYKTDNIEVIGNIHDNPIEEKQ